MALKTPNRYQLTLLPESIEDYVAKDDPVRAYDAMIDAINLDSIGLRVGPNNVGNPPYDPASMLKLLVYGYAYGWRSSRKLERAVFHNLSFIWLVGGLKPDHKTISNFRKNNKKALKKVFKQIARICLDLNLIEGNCLFVDGTKIRANASINQTKSLKRWKALLSDVDKRIDRILEEAEKVDAEESGSESLIKLSGELKDAKRLKAKIASLVEEARVKDLAKINGTDTDAVNVKGRQGAHAGFNAQIVVDAKNGLIASSDVTQDSNDREQFSTQINQAIDTLGKKPKWAVGDAGYSNVDDLKKIDTQEVDVIVPNQKQAEKKPKDEPFGKDKFGYDAERDEYICPVGERMYNSYFSKGKKQWKYRMKRSGACGECRHFGVCTTAKRGRTISRLENEELKVRLEARYESESGQAVYKQRKEKVELPFGHLKRTLNGGAFLTRGIEAVKAEFSIFASCFNIARMITLLGGVEGMIKAIRV